MMRRSLLYCDGFGWEIAALRGSPITGTAKFASPSAYHANTRLAAQKMVSDRPSAQDCVCMVIEIQVQ